MKKSLLHAVILVLFAGTAVAMDDTRPKPEPKKDNAQPLEQARAAIARKDWSTATAAARQAVERQPGSADAHNLYAFSMRKGPNPAMDLVFRHYNEALRIDPNHRGH